MRVAIPILKERVAPYFGASSLILLMDIDGASILQETELDVEGLESLELAHRLLDFGVEQVVCGGINRFQKQWLMNKGVAVVDNVRGDARKIVKTLLR
jgi:predicted Fe-Mo cluster-binding NifX family protein